jgi:anhydro-N-acetylmuramic acid kinase
MQNQHIIYGLMSGTSLDGVDIAACSFSKREDHWRYKILYIKTIPYDNYWRNKLIQAPTLSGEEIICLDREFGGYLGGLVNQVVEQSGIQPFLISSHGHTIFHSPAKKYSLQIGCGAEIAARTGIPVACDFRSTDVALGGQGAPLVPIGDKLLFSEYDACLNLGGFANISFERNNIRIAFDICPVNIVLNRFALSKGFDFDRNGEMGRAGVINQKLLKGLNALAFYHLPCPKSLSREWIQSDFDPIVKKHPCLFNNAIRTIYDHIAMQIGKIIDKNVIKNVLLTGGGTHNTFLLELIRKNCSTKLIIPDTITIDFKEALIFAFMGLLRYRGEINCLSSVTGASADSVCGAVYTKKGSGLEYPLS